MPLLSSNKKAYHDYHILEEYEAGIILLGPEVKSCRNNGISLKEGFVSLQSGEAFLVNAHIAPYKDGYDDISPTRKRKLLLNKKEIKYLKESVERKGLTLIPLRAYTTRGLIKVALGLAKGKKTHDKREDMKNKESKKQIRSLA